MLTRPRSITNERKKKTWCKRHRGERQIKTRRLLQKRFITASQHIFWNTRKFSSCPEVDTSCSIRTWLKLCNPSLAEKSTRCQSTIQGRDQNSHWCCRANRAWREYWDIRYHWHIHFINRHWECLSANQIQGHWKTAGLESLFRDHWSTSTCLCFICELFLIISEEMYTDMYCIPKGSLPTELKAHIGAIIGDVLMLC